MNTQEELTKLIMESYDRGVEDAKQAAIEVIQKAVLLEREACERAAGIALLGAETELSERVLKAIRARGNT